MKIWVLIIAAILMTSGFASAVTFSGDNIPYDATFHLGLVNGPGMGVAIGADVYFPLEMFKVGLEVEQQVTNTNFDQNLNILKYGLTAKYDVNEMIYLTFSFGTASFYISKIIDYVDSFSGEGFTIDEDTHGTASYIAFAPNFFIEEFIFTPKVVINTIADGGKLLEVDLNIGHAF